MLSYLNSNFALTLGYLNPALNNPALTTFERCSDLIMSQMITVPL